MKVVLISDFNKKPIQYFKIKKGSLTAFNYIFKWRTATTFWSDGSGSHEGAGLVHLMLMSFS